MNPALKILPVLTLPLFAATIFLASGLLFVVQPMFARMVLPRLGGSPAVWNTCVLFFQTALRLSLCTPLHEVAGREGRLRRQQVHRNSVRTEGIHDNEIVLNRIGSLHGNAAIRNVDLEWIAALPGWRRRGLVAGAPIWTDDYSNVFEVLTFE
jgi:hypothetical protein